MANLDFLRAVAVSLVLLFHLLRFFGHEAVKGFNLGWMGLIGVLFFFVHTCLVLMFSLERQRQKFGDRKLFTGFMLRRIFRIYPLSVFVVVVIALFKLPMGSLGPGRLEWLSVGRLGMISNLLLVQNITNTTSILGPLWSLPYEMQMYVFLPILFLLAQRLRTMRPLLGLWGLAVITAIVQARFGHMPDFVQYIPCFMGGIIAYKSWNQARRRLPFYGWALLVLGLSFITSVTYRPMVGWVTCLILGLAVPHFAEMSNRWLRRSSHLIAKYSYGIYLGHYFCIWLAFVKLAFLPAAAEWAVFVVTLVAIPVALFHGLEEPLIRIGGRLVDRYVSPKKLPVPVGELANS